jgi:hypothetical protein
MVAFCANVSLTELFGDFELVDRSAFAEIFPRSQPTTESNTTVPSVFAVEDDKRIYRKSCAIIFLGITHTIPFEHGYLRQ